MSGTEVTCRDLETDETDKTTITDDYVVITDGQCYLAGVQTHANGTHVLTVKRRLMRGTGRMTPSHKRVPQHSLPNASGSCSPLVGQAAQEDG